MSMLSIEMLTPDRVEQLSPYLESMFQEACENHEVVRDEMQGKDIVDLGKNGLAAIFVCYYNGNPSCALAIQFYEANGHKGADLIALAGKGKKLVQFKNAYWKSILEWLKANDVEFLDAYTPQSRALVYQKKFGFDKSCTYVRMTLH